MKYILISLLILFPITLSDTTSHACSWKKIINSDGHLSNSPNGDLTLAYNKVGSCISLQTDNDDEVCCYIKIRFKNELLDERFTHKGCQPVQTKYLLEDADPDIDDYIDSLEIDYNYVNDPDEPDDPYQIEYKSVEIDCISKFLTIGFGLLLLFLQF